LRVSSGKETCCNQCGQNFCNQKLRLVCQRENCNSQTIKIQPTTSCSVNFNKEINGACGHRPRFHKHEKQTTPITDESINDKMASLTHKVATDFAGCNVCLVDFQQEALCGPTKRTLRNNSNNLMWISHSLLFSMTIEGMRDLMCCSSSFVEGVISMLSMRVLCFDQCDPTKKTDGQHPIHQQQNQRMIFLAQWQSITEHCHFGCKCWKEQSFLWIKACCA